MQSVIPALIADLVQRSVALLPPAAARHVIQTVKSPEPRERSLDRACRCFGLRGIAAQLGLDNSPA